MKRPKIERPTLIAPPWERKQRKRPEMVKPPAPRPMYDPKQVRDLSIAVYQLRYPNALDLYEAEGKGMAELEIIARRYDSLTRAYLDAINAIGELPTRIDSDDIQESPPWA